MIQDGLGNTPPNSSLISTGITVAGGTTAAVLGTAGLTGALAAIGIGAWAVPFVGPIIGGLALAVGALGLGNGCGPTCNASTTVVNDVEPTLKQNLAAAQQQAAANGGCLTSAEQQVCVGVFNQVWNYVLSTCGKIPAPGGTQCVSDRQPGGKYDWTAYYLTPIMQIPVCSSPTSSVSAAVSSVSDLLGGVSPLWLVGGLGLVALLALGGD